MRLMNCVKDVFFKNSFRIANKVLTNDISILSSYALMIVKPETIVFQKLGILLKLIKMNDFIIIYCKKENINGAQIISLWEWSWDNATIERILLNQKLFELSYSLVLILKYVGNKNCIASEYLTFLKGSSNIEIREKGSFRDILKSSNFLINFIHTSDDVENFIREIGVLFSSDEIMDIYTLILNDYEKQNTAQPKSICRLLKTIKNDSLKANNKFIFNGEKDFYDFLENIKNKINIGDHYINHLLSKAQNNKVISNDLLWFLINNKLIEWNIKSLSVLTLYAIY